MLYLLFEQVLFGRNSIMNIVFTIYLMNFWFVIIFNKHFFLSESEGANALFVILNDQTRYVQWVLH